ncbi:MAG: peptidyl-prolyl cis-trans isomerase [Proteobacteria bacterium]|nr:peptidyl-prolyl cis-trans isomerase [Pseudomonadota bacterium]
MKILREPLLHFIVLGAALFALYYFVNDDPLPENPRSIIVDETILVRLSQTFERTWMRPPTAEEFDGLVESHIKEEILYREGLALGLDKDDLIIRRRMQQKFEFLNADLVELTPPTEAELQQYLDSNADKYRQPESISFQQVFIKTSGSEVDPQARAGRVLTSLVNNEFSAAEMKAMGDPSMLPRNMQDESKAGIARVFGGKFAELVATAEKGSWSGPYLSGYGLHLVYLSEFNPGRDSRLEEVARNVERDLTAERTRNANNQFYQALRKRYSIEVQSPQASAAASPQPAN